MQQVSGTETVGKTTKHFCTKAMTQGYDALCCHVTGVNINPFFAEGFYLEANWHRLTQTQKSFIRLLALNSEDCLTGAI